MLLHLRYGFFSDIHSSFQATFSNLQHNKLPHFGTPDRCFPYTFFLFAQIITIFFNIHKIVYFCLCKLYLLLPLTFFVFALLVFVTDAECLTWDERKKKIIVYLDYTIFMLFALSCFVLVHFFKGIRCTVFFYMHNYIILYIFFLFFHYYCV
jgi:hypothetical protein